MLQKQVLVTIIQITYFSNSLLAIQFCMFTFYFMFSRCLSLSCSYLFHIFSSFYLPFHHPSSINQFSINLFFSSTSVFCLLLLYNFLLLLPPPHPPFLIIFCHPALPVFHFNVFTLFCLPLAYLFPNSLYLSPQCSNSLFFPFILSPVYWQPTSSAQGSSYLRQKAETRRLSLEVKSNMTPLSLLGLMPCAYHTLQNITCTQVTAVQWHCPCSLAEVMLRSCPRYGQQSHQSCSILFCPVLLFPCPSAFQPGAKI